MIKNFLCIMIIFFLSIETKNDKKENQKSSNFCIESIVESDTLIVEKTDIPMEEKYPEVKELLLKVPSEQRKDFVDTLKTFADERGFDWRFCLLLMWGESGISTTAKANSFVGLIMFGHHARLFLKVSESELLQKNFVEQAKCAIMLWEETERIMKVKINDFQKLQIATFMPAWLNHHGNPYPASEIVKAQNYPLCDANGQMTKQSILNICRKKTYMYEELKYFRDKF